MGTPTVEVPVPAPEKGARKVTYEPEGSLPTPIDPDVEVINAAPDEYSYPDLEGVCWEGLGADVEGLTEEALMNAKKGPAAAAAERAAEAAAAGAAIVDKGGMRSSRRAKGSPAPKTDGARKTQSFS